MFRSLIVLVVIAAVVAFAPSSRFAPSTKLSMSADKISLNKLVGAAVVASTLFGGLPSFAKENAAANIGIFTSSPLSSPFVEETREDPIYSPYSPYGNGEAAVYNSKKGGAEELKFWNEKLANSVKRVANVPTYVAKKQWLKVNTEVTSYAYNLREAFLRVAAASKNPQAAEAAAKVYFGDIEDIFVNSRLKNGDAILAAYSKSLTDLSTFQSLTK